MHRIDRAAVFAKDHGICHLCGKPVNPDYYDVDHVLPRAREGTEDPANLRLSHPFCNRAKRDRTDYSAGLYLAGANDMPPSLYKMLGPNAYAGLVVDSELDKLSLMNTDDYKSMGLLVQLNDIMPYDNSVSLVTTSKVGIPRKVESELLYPVLFKEDIMDAIMNVQWCFMLCPWNVNYGDFEAKYPLAYEWLARLQGEPVSRHDLDHLPIRPYKITRSTRHQVMCAADSTGYKCAIAPMYPIPTFHHMVGGPGVFRVGVDTIEEAEYIVNILNSKLGQAVHFASYQGHVYFNQELERLWMPKYDPANGVHVAIATGDGTQEGTIANLWHLTSVEVANIREFVDRERKHQAFLQGKSLLVGMLADGLRERGWTVERRDQHYWNLTDLRARRGQDVTYVMVVAKTKPEHAFSFSSEVVNFHRGVRSRHATPIVAVFDDSKVPDLAQVKYWRADAWEYVDLLGT